jgi:hypothetical protein
MGILLKNRRTWLCTCGLALLAVFAYAGQGTAQGTTRSSTGSSGLGSSGIGSSGLGSSGIGSSGLGSSGIGSSGLGSSGIGSSGLGSSGLGSTGLGSTGLGSTSLGGSNMGSSGSFSGSLGSTSLGSVNRSFGGGGGYGGGFGGGSGAAGLTSGISAASYAGISSSNLFGNYYSNPLAAGLGSSSTQSRFGAPLYTLSNTTNTNLTGTANVSTTTPVGGSYGGGRARIYVAPDREPSPPIQLELRRDLQQVLARSTSLPSRDNMQVLTDGNVVVLRGTVSSEGERRLAEALMRLTPGVRQVSNELQVSR